MKNLALSAMWVLLAACQLFGTSIRAVYVETPIKIDGKVDDATWQQATRVSGFIQREPNTGELSSEETVAYICYDKNNIYFGIICYQDPSTITAKEIARDVSLRDEDKITITLDTFLDRRNAYWFQINSRGSMGDALRSQNGAVSNSNWDGIWRARSSINERGWETEVAIPFKTLNFHPTQTTWGLKLTRDIQFRSETTAWPVANINGPKYQVADGADLEGLHGLSKGIGLDIRPYALGGIDQERGEDTKLDGDIGFDLFYRLTPGLKSVLTVNTDFAQTEVDARQVNLTRFRLFFPEKRDFFLDGANYFQFANEGSGQSGGGGGGTPRMVTFFSRCIGLDDDGTPIPIIAGGKITGQAGPWNLGLLDVVDQRDDRNQNFGVARITRNFGEQSYIGGIGTLGNAESSDRNSVVGADIKLATSRLAGNKNLNFYLFGLKSTTENLSGRDTAFGTELTYPNDFLDLEAGYVQIGENYKPGIGFVPRRDIRNAYGSLTLGPRPRKWGILQVEIGGEFDYITDFDNLLLTREIEVEPLGIRFLSGDEISIGVSRIYELLDEDFNIYEDVVIPAGTYEFTRPEIRFGTAQRRRLWTEIDYEWGEFWTGHADQIELAAGFKVSVPIALELEFEHNDVRLPEGDFTVNVYRVNFDLLFSPRTTLLSFIQYDDESRTIGWQSRLRWIINPGNEILFAWNSLWNDPMDRRNPHLSDFSLAESTTRLKINYNYRF